MTHLFQKLHNIFRRKPRPRGLFGTPLFAAAREEAKRHAAESRHAERFICGTFLMNLTPEQREAYFKSCREKKANEA